MDVESSKTRSAMTGVLGFWLGGILGGLTLLVLAISGGIGRILSLVPEGQAFVRLLTAVLLAFIMVALAGAVTGVFNGYILSRIDRAGTRRQLMVGGGFAYGIGQGTLFIPSLLIISVLALYNNGHPSQPLAYVLLFGLLGLIYGLLVGVIFSMLTIKFKRLGWVLLAYLLGYMLGGILLGLFIWQAGRVTAENATLRTVLRILSVSLAYNIGPGILVGLAMRNLAQKRATLGDEALRPGRVQRTAVFGTSLLIFFLVASISRNAQSFLTINPASTDTQLGSSTVGVHWAPAESIVSLSQAENPSSPAIAASGDKLLGAAWTAAADGGSEVFYTAKDIAAGEAGSWSAPVNVSNDPFGQARSAQMVMDSRGQAHVVWEGREAASGASLIFYSRCEGETCTPPQSISASTDLGCAAQVADRQPRQPAIAIDAEDQLMAAWSTADGAGFYLIWPAGETPPPGATGCLPFAGSAAGQALALDLTGGAAGHFAVGYNAAGEQPGDIFTQQYSGEAWSNATEPIGTGFTPVVRLDSADRLTAAWCDEHGTIQVQLPGEPTESIDTAACRGQPGLGQDDHGAPHLVWSADQVENISGVTSPENLLYESIRTADGWSPPAIIVQTSAEAQPAMTSTPGGELHLAWDDTQAGSTSLNYASQAPYECSIEALNMLGRVALETIQQGNFHPADYQVPFCDNQFIDFVYQPNPREAFSTDQPTENGGFDRVAQLVQDAQYEVLFVNMQWDADENDLSPGFTFADEVARLYQQVKANPSQYPRGMLVRILLGNYPEMSTLEWGTQIWNVFNDLRDSGLEVLENPEIGWRVEVADYAGTWPHSHTKFVVVDGKLLIGAGFNYSWFHLPRDHPSGRGEGLTDLGIAVLGPAAQPAITAHDEMWEGANQLVCPDFDRPDESWSESCEWVKAQVWHVPEVLKYYPTDSQYNAFALFRTSVYKEADKTYSTVLAAAQTSIDAIHVNFSLELICMINIVDPEICNYDNSLEWMQAMMTAIEQNHTQVRVIVENANSNGLENRVAIKVFQDELAKRGLSEYFEVRFFDGRLHMKSALVDQELLIVGSQNFHYSSFGESGLLEFVVASDDPTAIETYQEMFDYYWDQAIPAAEADWATAP
jgi:phosphatidylserine/phosphatidylglycerophosphate/cardiolipin synthase-like enzyme